MTRAPVAAYQLPGFALFYDEMVKILPVQEYEVGLDIDFLYSLLQSALLVQDEAYVLDLCAGTGRVSIGLIERVLSDPLILRETETRNMHVNFYCVDTSQEMLRRCEEKMQQFHRYQRPYFHSFMIPASACHLLETMPYKKFDLVAILAGSFQHLLSIEEQQNCLSGIYRLLSSEQHAACVIGLLPSEETNDLTLPAQLIPPIVIDVYSWVLKERYVQECQDNSGEKKVKDIYELRKLVGNNVDTIEFQQYVQWEIRLIKMKRLLQLIKKLGFKILGKYRNYEEAACLAKYGFKASRICSSKSQSNSSFENLRIIIFHHFK